MKITIDRAIEILTLMGRPEFEGHTEDILAARQQGVGALQRIKQMRVPGDTLANYPLPGETERRRNGNERGIDRVSQRV